MAAVAPYLYVLYPILSQRGPKLTETFLSASAYPTYAPQPTPTITPTPTTPTICPTACPTSTSTIHPGYHCPVNRPYKTLGCPLADCRYEPPTTTTVTSYLPCFTTTTAASDGCTVPQSCVGLPVSTVLVMPTVCPTSCPKLCPKSIVTESRLLGGGCPMTA